MTRPIHLIKRFVASLAPAGPRPQDEVWARSLLLPAEAELWEEMSRPDRRHAIAVARRIERSLGNGASRPVMAAALLHDVGKIASALGTCQRVVATVIVAAAGYRRSAAWAGRGGWKGRLGLYVTHPQLGAEMLRRAGSDPLTVAWTAEHQSTQRSGDVPPEIAAALRAADG